MKSPSVEDAISKLPLPEPLERLPDGEIRIRGHRVSLFDVADALIAGEPLARIRSCYPTIPARALRQVEAFCNEHADQVRIYHAEKRAAAEALRSSRPHDGPTLAELRGRVARKAGRG
jgi:uncharacterized protein (DUF433 family)